MSDEIILKSGKKIYAHRNIVGIDDKLELSQGYDGGMPATPNCDYYADMDDNILTKEETLELADLMINRWQQFRKING